MDTNGASLHVVAGLAGVAGIRGGFKSSTDHIQHLEIPRDIKREDVERAQRDCEILAERLRDHPEEMSALLRNLQEGDLTGAHEAVKKLGLREEDFVVEGGGALWMLVLLVGMLYATPAY